MLIFLGAESYFMDLVGETFLIFNGQYDTTYGQCDTLTLLLYCKLSKASAFGPWRPPLQQPLFANMWGARRLLRTYVVWQNREERK